MPGEVCTETSPGVYDPDGGAPHDYFVCIPAPAICAGNDTCACVLPAMKQGGMGCYPISCDDQFGNPVVQCMGF